MITTLEIENEKFIIVDLVDNRTISRYNSELFFYFKEIENKKLIPASTLKIQNCLEKEWNTYLAKYIHALKFYEKLKFLV